MNLEADDDLLIKRYLLAAVSEDEREQVEKRLMSDDDFFQQINLVEDELVDQYLDGELSEADRRRFEVSFLCAPERQHKLRFARALRTYAAGAAHEGASRQKPEKKPALRSLLDILKPTRVALGYALAVALLILVAGASVRMIALKGQISEMQARQRLREAEEARWRAELDEQRARVDRVVRQLQSELERRSAAQPAAGASTLQIAMLNPPPFPLSAGVQRGGSSPSLAFPLGALLVRLELDLARNPFPTYRAVLLSEGKEILSRSALRASEARTAITLGLSLPAADLPDGDYELRLYGTGAKDYLESYVFHVTRK